MGISNNKLISPISLQSISNLIGNPMLDVGYQCMDSKPYFKFVNGSNVIYTDSYPSRIPNIVSTSTINIYSVSEVSKNGGYITFYKMTFITNLATATSTTITYNGTVYTYDNTHADIRLFLINKWSKNKPVQFDTVISELSDDNKVAANYGFSIEDQLSSNLSEILEMADGFTWWYNAPSADNWKRMTDFINYNHVAECPIAITISSQKGVEGYSSPQIKAHLDINTSSDLKLTEINKTLSNGLFKWCVLYRKSGTTGDPTVVNTGVVANDTNEFSSSSSVDNQSVGVATNYDVCVALYKEGDGYINVEGGYKKIELLLESVEASLGITAHLDTFLVVGNKNKVYCRMLLTDSQLRNNVSVEWEIRIQIRQKSGDTYIIKNVLTDSGTTVLDFSATNPQVIVPQANDFVLESVSGVDYGKMIDEAGIDQNLVSYNCIATFTMYSYTITKTKILTP